MAKSSRPWRGIIEGLWIFADFPTSGNKVGQLILDWPLLWSCLIGYIGTINNSRSFFYEKNLHNWARIILRMYHQLIYIVNCQDK